MASVAGSVYKGISEVNFYRDDEQGLLVTIETARLYICSVLGKEKDYENYSALFGDVAVMEKYAKGITKTNAEVRSMIDNRFAKRWRESDPYSGFAVYTNDSDTFLGHVVLGHGDSPGESELAYLFMRAHWNKGYGTEAVSAVVREYAPATVKEGYRLEGKPLQKIVATTRPDNPASARILQKVGMHLVKDEERHGALRHHYSIDLTELQKKPAVGAKKVDKFKPTAKKWSFCTLL